MTVAGAPDEEVSPPGEACPNAEPPVNGDLPDADELGLERISAALTERETIDYINEAKQLRGQLATDERLLGEVIKESPFLDLTSPMTAWEWFKIAILFPWTLFRIVLVLVLIPPVWATCKLFSIGSTAGVPAGPHRAALLRALLRFWALVYLKLICHMWHIKVKGRENYEKAKEARAVLVINHVSYVDPIVMVAHFAPSAVAKAGVAKLPFFGTFASALQTVFVERKGFDVANTKTLRKGGAQLVAERAKDERYPLVMVAPEGTTKPAHCLLRFSTGAFVAGQPVAPILLRYSGQHFNVGWGLADVGWHMWRLIHQFNNCCEVEVCPPYMPSSAEKQDARLYADNVRRHMATLLGCPCVNVGIPELICLYEAGVRVDKNGRKVVAPHDAHERMVTVKVDRDAAKHAPKHALQSDGNADGGAAATCADGDANLPAANGAEAEGGNCI